MRSFFVISASAIRKTIAPSTGFVWSDMERIMDTVSVLLCCSLISGQITNHFKYLKSFNNNRAVALP